MNETILGAIIGTIGTLLGTILGWLLNSIGKSGKLIVNDLTWKDKFEFNNKGVMSLSKSKTECEEYSFSLECNIYNSSSDIKIMKNINVEFYKDKELIFSCITKDESTRRWGTGISSVDNLKLINIYPKTVLNYNLSNWFWKEKKDFIWETNSIFLSYQDEKGKNKKIKIKESNYSNYFIDDRTVL